MISVINLDQFIEVKEDIEKGLAIFLLDDEMNHVGHEQSWLANVKLEVYLVRMEKDDFQVMDIATHPHTFIIKDGKEIKTMNGIPSEGLLGECL